MFRKRGLGLLMDREPVVIISCAFGFTGLALPLVVPPIRRSMGLPTNQYDGTNSLHDNRAFMTGAGAPAGAEASPLAAAESKIAAAAAPPSVAADPQLAPWHKAAVGAVPSRGEDDEDEDEDEDD